MCLPILFSVFIRQPLKKKLYHFICIDGVSACMSVNHVHVYVQCPRKLERPEGSFRSSETGDNRCFELPELSLVL